MINALGAVGVSDAIKISDANFLHPNIETDGWVFLGILRGKQRLLLVKERKMNNWDGAEWLYPGQTKTCLYYLEEVEEGAFEWYYACDLSTT